MGEFDKTLGALLVGIFFNTFLYGLVLFQFATYYRAEFNDRPIIKFMVLFLFLLDTFQSASAIYMAWTYTVTNFGNPAALQVAEWPYAFTPIGTAATALVTQIFLGYRIWCLSGNIHIYVIVIVMAIPSFALGMACGIGAWIIKILVDFPRLNSLAIAWLTMQMTVDAFITVTLTVLLLRAKTGYAKTDSVLNRLIRGAIQTGLFAGLFSIGVFVSFLRVPTTNLYAMFAIPIGRIYTNTLLDTLLAREALKEQMSGTYDRNTANDINWSPSNASQIQTSFQLEVHRTVQEYTDSTSLDGDGKAIAL